MQQLAERAGISQGFISRLESGERGASRENVEALAAALDAAPLDRYKLLLAAEWVVPLDPPLEDLLVLLWNDDLPPAARARIEAALEVAAAYGRAALESADDA
jgi:transcriptional regulator with XRE-family HTH domain